MDKFICAICDREHTGLPLDVAYKRPDQFFAIPKDELKNRAVFTDDGGWIDDKQFFIRGVLKLPIHETESEFAFGAWAEIQEQDFLRYLEIDINNADVTQEPHLLGRLANELITYPQSANLDITIRLMPLNKRPLFNVVAQQHQLEIDQRTGISMEKVHRIIHLLQP